MCADFPHMILLIIMASLKLRTKNEVEIVSFIYNYNITLESITFQCDIFSIEYSSYYNIYRLSIFIPFQCKMSNTRTENYFAHRMRIQSLLWLSSSRPPHFEWINIISPFSMIQRTLRWEMYHRNYTRNGNPLIDHHSWCLMWNLRSSSDGTAFMYAYPKLSFCVEYCSTLLTKCALHHWVWFISRKILALNIRTRCKTRLFNSPFMLIVDCHQFYKISTSISTMTLQRV